MRNTVENCSSSSGHLRLELIASQLESHVKMSNFKTDINMFTAQYKNPQMSLQINSSLLQIYRKNYVTDLKPIKCASWLQIIYQQQKNVVVFIFADSCVHTGNEWLIVHHCDVASRRSRFWLTRTLITICQSKVSYILIGIWISGKLVVSPHHLISLTVHNFLQSPVTAAESVDIPLQAKALQLDPRRRGKSLWACLRKDVRCKDLPKQIYKEISEQLKVACSSSHPLLWVWLL